MDVRGGRGVLNGMCCMVMQYNTGAKQQNEQMDEGEGDVLRFAAVRVSLDLCLLSTSTLSPRCIKELTKSTSLQVHASTSSRNLLSQSYLC